MEIRSSPEDALLLAGYSWYIVQDGKQFYAYANVPGGTVKMHRVVTGARPGQEVDHRNGDGLDNRRSNLRIATRSQNARNAGKKRGTYSSRYKGIYWYPRVRKWRAQIRIDGRRKSLGYFADEVEAAKAYDAAAVEHHGEFAHPNFPGTREVPQPEG